MRLKLRDVTFVGTVALWFAVQALCERAPSLIYDPFYLVFTDINAPKIACAVYSCVLNTAVVNLDLPEYPRSGLLPVSS
jgi:hypothetical protein